MAEDVGNKMKPPKRPANDAAGSSTSGSSAKKIMKCKACEGTDHERRSHKKCKFHKPSAKELISIAECGVKPQTVVVKCGLKRICKDENVRLALQADVDIISRVLIETSFFLEFALRHEGQWLLKHLEASRDKPDLTFLANFSNATILGGKLSGRS